jgi:hypothetical protein
VSGAPAIIPTPDALSVAGWLARRACAELRKADLTTGMRHRACGRVARLNPAIEELEAIGALCALPRQPGSKTIRYAVRLERLPRDIAAAPAGEIEHSSAHFSEEARADAAVLPVAAQISAESFGATETSDESLAADLRALIQFVAAAQGSTDSEVRGTMALAAQHPERVRACLAQLARAEIDRMVAPSAGPRTAASITASAGANTQTGQHVTQPTPLIPPTDNPTSRDEPAITMTDLMQGAYECGLLSPAEPNVGPCTDLQRAVDGVTPLASAVDTIMRLQPEYGARHGIDAASVLTIMDDGDASHVANYLADRIRGKVVVELGCGTGRLALHLGRYAKHVYAIEANPAWTWAFVELLYRSKPRNVSFLFGAADEFIGRIRGDVALFCTQSDVSGLGHLGAQFAPVVIDVYEVESGRVWVSHPKKPLGARGAA